MSWSTSGRLGTEMLFELFWDTFPAVGVGGRIRLSGNIRPLFRGFGVHRYPFLRPRVGIRPDGLRRAPPLADPAGAALPGPDHQHVFPPLEAIDGANSHASPVHR